MLPQTDKTRTVWLNEGAQIVSFHVVDGWQREELVCPDDVFMRFLQALQAQGYRFQ